MQAHPTSMDLTVATTSPLSAVRGRVDAVGDAVPVEAQAAVACHAAGVVDAGQDVGSRRV